MPQGIFTSLAERDFRWLWTGTLASSFAMNMQIVARGWLVYDITGSALDLGWVTMSFTLPQVAFSLWGGVVADRLPKRQIIASAQSLNFLATSIMATIVITGSVTFWDFIWFGFFNGTVLALSMPARQAFVPELVGEGLVFNAIALNTASWNLSRILGPSLAGGIIAVVAAGDRTSTFGVGVVYWMITGLYLIAGISVLLVRRPARLNARETGETAIGDITEGFRYVVANPPVLGLILLSLTPFLFGMPINTLLPAFNKDILGGGPEDLGYLLTSMGLGAIVGSLMLARANDLRHKRTWLIGTCVAWGVLMVLFAEMKNLLAAASVISVIGWLSAWNMSLNRGLLQVIAEPKMRGRIMSIDMMSHGLMPLGILPITYIAEAWSVEVALSMAGVVLAASVVALSRVRSVSSIGS
jgi:MFS family permease